MSEVREVEWEAWEKVALQARDNGAAVLTLCGPSGSGKSTIARKLQDFAQIYLEDVSGNPHLPDLLAGRLDRFDAGANQAWFLERMLEFVQLADPNHPLVLDQDPAAIVFAYAQMWRTSGHLSDRTFTALLAKLIKLEEALWRWRAPRSTLLLDAPAAELYRRVHARDSKTTVPPTQWFEEVRVNFAELNPRFPRAVVAPSVASVEEIVRVARDLLNS